MKQTATLELDEEKKHSVRYRDPSNDWVIYVPKDLLGKRPYPKEIKIELEWEDE